MAIGDPRKASKMVMLDGDIKQYEMEYPISTY